MYFQQLLTAQRRSLETMGAYAYGGGAQQVHRNSRHVADAAEKRADVYNPYVYKYLKHRRRRK